MTTRLLGVTYHWETNEQARLLMARVRPARPSYPHAVTGLAALSDHIHRYVDQFASDLGPDEALHLAIDLSGADVRLRLDDLMESTYFSARVSRLAIIGARSRADEMAMMIMSTAKRLPYDVAFFPDVARARPWLAGLETPSWLASL